jgi:hypothetical protein
MPVAVQAPNEIMCYRGATPASDRFTVCNRIVFRSRHLWWVQYAPSRSDNAFGALSRAASSCGRTFVFPEDDELAVSMRTVAPSREPDQRFGGRLLVIRTAS